MTHGDPPLSESGRVYGRAAPHRYSADAGGWLAGGAVAAGLGLGTCAVLVMLLWVTSPYSDTGPGDALRIAADIWLLAHGAQLVREHTLTGQPAPMEMTPLLLAALPGWLLYRGTRSVFAGELREHEEQSKYDGRSKREARNGTGVQNGTGGREQSTYKERSAYGERRAYYERRGLLAAGWCAAGYLLIGMAAVGFASTGPVRVDLLSGLLQLPLFVLCVTAVAVWTGNGRPLLRLPAALRGACTKSLRRVLNWQRLIGSAQAACVSVVALTGGGALLLAAALTWNFRTAQASFPQLAGSWTGYAGVLLLTFVLVLNGAVWAASYALGPGFTLGAGSVVGPLSAAGHPQLPQFPLLAALPPAGSVGGPVVWAVVGALPLTAGVLCGWYLGREAAPVRGRRDGARGWRGTVLNAGLAAVWSGLATGVLAACAGGALGTGVLVRFGPGAMVTGAAAVAWTAVPAAPVALLVRWLRLRRGRSAAQPEPGAESA